MVGVVVMYGVCGYVGVNIVFAVAEEAYEAQYTLIWPNPHLMTNTRAFNPQCPCPKSS